MDELKATIMKAAQSGAYIKRACDDSLVEIDDQALTDVNAVSAVNELFRSGHLEQLPTSGQARTMVTYKIASQDK